MFDLSIDSEILSQDEIAILTGCARKNDPIEWPTNNDWAFHKNRRRNAPDDSNEVRDIYIPDGLYWLVYNYADWRW